MSLRPVAIAPSRPRRGLSLVELLVAIAIALILVGVTASVFLTMLRILERTEIQTQATQNLRAALDTISREVKQVEKDPANAYYLATSTPALDGLGGPYGDGIDNDEDGSIDEEEPDALDDDGDASEDRHALVAGSPERPAWVGVDDLGDGGVDEDRRFHLDTLEFEVGPDPVAGYLEARIRYEVQPFDGEERVLTRTLTATTLSSGTLAPVTAPLAYNVLSFNCLHWNPNEAPASQYWLESWDSAAPPGLPGPSEDFAVPSTLFVELVLYADRRPIETYEPGQPVQTLALQTIVNVESVILDSDFPSNP